MDVLDQGLGVGLLVGLIFGVLGVARKGSLVVEAVEIASGLFELLDPFLGLRILLSVRILCISSEIHYLGDHHVTIKGSASVTLGRLLDVSSNLGDDWWTESNVGNKVTVPIHYYH